MQNVFRLLRDAPSLRAEVTTFATAAYVAARRRAARETGVAVAQFPVALPMEFLVVAEALANVRTDGDIDALIRSMCDD
jgi:hypothetical protein